MHKSHPLPVRHHLGSTATDLGKPLHKALLRIGLLLQQPGEISPDDELHQLAQQGQITARRRQLEMAEANEGRCHPADNGARLGPRIAVIEHVTHHGVAGGHQAQGAGGGYTQVIHGFAAKKFAYRRTQHRPAVSRT